MGDYTFLIPSVDNLFEINKPIGQFSGYKTGGNASYYFEPNNLKQLTEAITFCKDFGKKYKVIGNGTNLLISDFGYDGLIISLKKLSKIVNVNDFEVKVNAGANLNALINFCLDNGLSGLESLYGIPATIGGAVCMNAGAFNTQIFDSVSVIEFIKNNKFYRIDINSCKHSYRSTRFLHNDDVIISVRFIFKPCDKNTIYNKMQECLINRKTLQPSGKSCGSVFKNPKGYFAGELIEKTGLKGYKIGGAEVSTKHANFILAKDNCTSLDIKRLIDLIKTEVYNKFNVKLTEEIEYLGDF